VIHTDSKPTVAWAALPPEPCTIDCETCMNENECGLEIGKLERETRAHLGTSYFDADGNEGTLDEVTP
jgi:hypothetical protein